MFLALAGCVIDVTVTECEPGVTFCGKYHHPLSQHAHQITIPSLPKRSRFTGGIIRSSDFNWSIVEKLAFFFSPPPFSAVFVCTCHSMSAPVAFLQSEHWVWVLHIYIIHLLHLWKGDQGSLCVCVCVCVFVCVFLLQCCFNYSSTCCE